MKNRILLIVPPSSLFPIGMAYVAAVLESGGWGYDAYGFYHDRSVWDNRAWCKQNAPDSKYSTPAVQIPANDATQTMLRMIAQRQYDYILVGGLVGFLKWFYALLPFFKQSSKDSTIILGGGITKDFDTSQLFEFLDVDFVLRGEAETNLLPLLALLERKQVDESRYSGVPGLCWRNREGGIRRNPISRHDIRTQPVMPAWESMNALKYIELSKHFPIPGKTNFPVLIGRGCTNVCAFCSPTIGRYRPSDFESVFAEMEHWRSRFRFDYFSLSSEVAFSNDEQTFAFCERYKRVIDMPWVAQLRTDINLSDKTYQAMADSGCKILNFGFESANDEILKRMRKNTTRADHLRNIEQARRVGITISGSFIFGHEGETAEQMRETFDFLREYDLLVRPNLGVNSLTIYPGTTYFRRAFERGMVEDKFRYLLNYSNKSGVYDVNIRNHTQGLRVNISALNDDEFYDVVCTEIIKNHHEYYGKHELLDLEVSFDLGRKCGYAFRGNCPVCGAVVDIGPGEYRSEFKIDKTCGQCYRIVNVEVFKLSAYRGHLERLRGALSACERILLVGAPVMEVLFNGSFRLDYRAVIAWYNPFCPQQSQEKYFFGKPQLPLAQYPSACFDAAVSVGCFPDLHAKLGIPSDIQVYNLYPDATNAYLVETLEKSRVALLGDAEFADCFGFLAGRGCSLASYDSIAEVDSDARHFDYLIYSRKTFEFSREEAALKTSFRLAQVLTPDLLFNGGLCRHESGEKHGI